MKIPILKYFGSKFSIRKKVIAEIPEDYKFFRSVFFGGGGVEFSLPSQGKSEVWNDLDSELFNFYRVLQSPDMFTEFKSVVDYTLFSQEEFEAAKAFLDIPLDFIGESPLKAAKFFIRNRLSRSGSGESFSTTTGRLRRGMNENVSAWLTALEELDKFHQRAKFVEVTKMDFRDFIPRYDREDAFFLLDPPYLHETRVAGGYNVEMTKEDHEDLLEILGKLKGRFLLHGYPSELYSAATEAYGWNNKLLAVKKSMSSAEVKPDAVEVFTTNYSLT